jgi:hypothetical protein
MIVTCDKCEKTANVNMYFFDIRIKQFSDPFLCNTELYRATCLGKAICPNCGSDIMKYYSRPIENEDILKIATGKEALE